MPKRAKITLYVILVLAIIAVIWLMFGQTNLKTQTPIDTNTEILTGEDITDEPDTIDLESQDNAFEDDVIKDLEGFFNDNNGYEDVEGEYGFTNPEDE